MPARTSKQQCQSRRKPSSGKLRRAHPASGASWNVQVVRGKITTKCLWHACRALVLGIVLMVIGAGMATLGYYAEYLSVGSDEGANATVHSKNDSRAFRLNNLSYVGPVIMGFGGFIVVAACVMTFEARDSAAKVVPARIKSNGSSRSNPRSNSSSGASQRRVNGNMQPKTRWDNHLGVFRSSPAESSPQQKVDRQALTAALVHFSKTLGNSPRQSPRQSPGQSPRLSPNLRRFSHTGSVPNLTSITPTNRYSSLSPASRKQIAFDTVTTTHRYQRHPKYHHGRHLSKARSGRVSGSLVERNTRDSASSLLHPGTLLKLHRHAISVDEAGPYYYKAPINDSVSSIQMSVDGHEGRPRDRTKQSDTARRHVLSRQRPIEKEEPHSPKLEHVRRSSTISDASTPCRRKMHGRALSTSRTPSVDSRSVHAEMHSPEVSQRPSPRTPRRFNSAVTATPSVEREFRSQLSVCSEPIVIRQLSGQSSMEPCVLEESPEHEEKPTSPTAQKDSKSVDALNSLEAATLTVQHPKKPRPETLPLDASSSENTKSMKAIEAKKYLFRSNSSTTFYRPKPKPIHDYEPLLLAAGRVKAPADEDEDELYDSLRVINERRKKILKAECETRALSVSAKERDGSGGSDTRINIEDV